VLGGLLVSACLAQLFPPVEIDGELYRDGGYAPNPPPRPLIAAGAPTDVILVPTGRSGTAGAAARRSRRPGADSGDRLQHSPAPGTALAGHGAAATGGTASGPPPAGTGLARMLEPSC